MLCDFSFGLKIDWFSQRMSRKVKGSLQKKIVRDADYVEKISTSPRLKMGWQSWFQPGELFLIGLHKYILKSNLNILVLNNHGWRWISDKAHHQIPPVLEPRKKNMII